MSRAFDVIPLVLKHEGGFVNDPRDAGGATNKGITIKTFQRYIKPSGTVEDLKRLTTEQAVVVYKRQYWDAVSADLLPRGVDYAVFDFAVNSGPSRAARSLQRVVGAKEDGIIGPATLEAVEAYDQAQIIADLCEVRLAFLKAIRGGKDWQAFGRGWSRRVREVKEGALEMARTPEPQGAYAEAPRDSRTKSKTMRSQIMQWGSTGGLSMLAWWTAQDTEAKLIIAGLLAVGIVAGSIIFRERLRHWAAGVR